MIGIPDKERIFYFDGSEDRGSVFTGFAEGACDLRGGAGDEYHGTAGSENVSVRGSVFAHGGNEGAYLIKD